jgi:hypothetical protein
LIGGGGVVTSWSGIASRRNPRARRNARPQPTETLEIPTHSRTCPIRGGPLRAANIARRTVTTLEGLVRLQVRSRRNPDRARYKVCLRPEQEGRFALPRHEFGLGVPICVRSIGNLPDRYDELRALSCSEAGRLRAITAKAGRVVLAVDGLRPDVGHEVLWVIRDVLSGEVLLARSLPSSCQDDLVKLSRAVKGALDVPIAGVVSDSRTSIRKAAAEALKGVPHQLRHSHYLREAAPPVSEADRHAKVRLKKEVRGVRPIERMVAGRDDPEAEVVRGYCAAVRSALTDDGRPPLAPSGLKPADRLREVASSLDRVVAKRGSRRSGPGRGRSWSKERPGGDRVVVARDPGGVRLGPAVRRGPGRHEGLGRRGGPPALPRAHRVAGAAPRRVRRPGGGVRPLPEGDAERLGRAVPRLRRGGAAADEQRPGAVLRVVPVPRTAVQRAEGGVPGDGRAGRGTAGVGGRDPAAADRRRGPGAVGPEGLAGPAPLTGAQAGGAGAGSPLPSRPRGLPPIA